MAIFNVFKRRKKPERKEAKEKPKKEARASSEVKPAEKSGGKPTEAKSEAKFIPSQKRKIGGAWWLLKELHVTEKATDLTKQNQYVFKVWQDANKIEIKKAVEDLYGVNVVSVRVVKVPRRKRRLGKIKGWRKGYKKAIVRLKEGQKIEVLPR